MYLANSLCPSFFSANGHRWSCDHYALAVNMYTEFISDIGHRQDTEHGGHWSQMFDETTLGRINIIRERETGD